jgi:hypothetical protein
MWLAAPINSTSYGIAYDAVVVPAPGGTVTPMSWNSSPAFGQSTVSADGLRAVIAR